MSFKDVKEVKHHAFDYELEGEDMEFKTSMSQWWFPEIDPISFTPAQFHFHTGKGVTKSKSDDGSEHTLNGKHFDMEMHIVNLNLNKETQDKFLAAVIGILF